MSTLDSSSIPAGTADRLLPRAKKLVAMCLFWTAIGLPAVYLAMLVDGIGTAGELRTFLALFGLHVVALLGGRYHR